MRVEYSSNNSGGSWWLKDEDWRALEAGGWNVVWGGQYFCHSRYSTTKAPTGKPEPCATAEECSGHRKFDSAAEMTEADRWLGCLAKEASKEFDSPGDAMREFERITGQSVTDEGCNCCGAPHFFSWPEGYASGEGCVPYLYGDNAPRSLREACERMR